MLGSPILYLKGMRILMFQLSGFYYGVEIYMFITIPTMHHRFMSRTVRRRARQKPKQPKPLPRRCPLMAAMWRHYPQARDPKKDMSISII